MDEIKQDSKTTLDSKKRALTPIKEYPSTIKTGLIVLLSLLLIYEIIILFVDIDPVTISITVQEVPNTSGTFELLTKNIIRMVLLGPVHGIIIYLCLRPLINQCTLTHKKLGSFLDVLLILFLMINCTGHIVHWLFDRTNSLYQQDFGGYSNNPSYLLAYFSDEFLGHGLVHVSYFVFFVIIGIIEYHKPLERNLHIDEWIIATGLGVGIAVINGIAAKIGESLSILSILSLIAVVTICISFIRPKSNPFSFKRQPFIWALFLGSLFVVGYTLYSIITDGFISAYPYIT